MHSNAVIDFSDTDVAELSAIVTAVERANADRAAAEVAQVRALARAGALAARQAAGQASRVGAHDMALRGIAAELAGVSRTSDRSMQRQIDEARVIVDDYPTSLCAWERGEITRGHVRAITDAGTPLPPGARAEFDRRAVALCLDQTPNQARGPLEILAARLHPRTPVERYRDAHENRTVRVVPLPDGMADLCVTMAAVKAHAVFDRITQMARTITDARTPDPATGRVPDPIIATDTRTMDQIRADVVAAMLLAGDPLADTTIDGDGPGELGAIRAKVQIVVPALTLLGTDAEPAELVGHCPIDAETARELAFGASWWERLVTDPVIGTVLECDGYARPAALGRWLRARDRRCRFPGCTMPAIRSEVDHTIDYALGGTTEATNLAHLCQRHHSMKQFTAWKVRQLEHGVLEWTSPTGRVYLENPPPISVAFTVDDPPGDRSGAPPGVPLAEKRDNSHLSADHGPAPF